MKTWEMIKELTENPRKVFISNKSTDSEMIARIKHGCLFIEDTLRGLTSVSLNREWEEVKKPVDFMAAVRSGKRIKIEHSCLDGSLDYLTTNYNELGDVLDEISTYLSDIDIRKILVNGKWYIED